MWVLPQIEYILGSVTFISTNISILSTQLDKGGSRGKSILSFECYSGGSAAECSLAGTFIKSDFKPNC